MSFNYNKSRDHGSNDSFWTSYSDLFLGLSTVFLLLYVVASLRTGTEGLRNQIENQKLARQVSELEFQLKTYESIKDEYLQKQASKDESQEYQELMDKLTLLQEEAKTEKDKLIEQALENEKKVKALNKYQQMVRNILNANKVAKTQINNRDDLIKEQDTTIQEKEVQIASLSDDILQKEKMIQEGESQIRKNQEELARKAAELQQAFRSNKLSKEKYQAALKKAQEDSQKTAQMLNEANEQYRSQIQQATAQLGQVQGELAKVQNLVEEKEGEVQKLAGDLSKTKAEAQAQVAAANEGLAKEKAAAAAKVADLSGKLSEAQTEVARARAELAARQQVANEIKKGFAAKGIKADVDMKTGDVVIDFGEAYFESGSSKLKDQMKGIIEKAIPVYSQSLLGNPKVADKISSVEIIGFASPTYKGRFVDPRSTKPDDKAALKYNMDLSYKRANSIYSYMLDNPTMKFAHQDRLMSLMKVSGRSFLEVMKVQNRNVASAAEFCKQNDCKKAQRVIIRFSMDPKK